MAVAVVAVGAAEHEWRFVLVRRELLLCSEQGVKAVSRILSEKVGGVMMMRVESDGARVSVVWKRD
jgi:hypothetical protein